MFICLFLSLSLYIYIYIHMYLVAFIHMICSYHSDYIIVAMLLAAHYSSNYSYIIVFIISQISELSET